MKAIGVSLTVALGVLMVGLGGWASWVAFTRRAMPLVVKIAVPGLTLAVLALLIGLAFALSRERDK